MHSSPDLNEYI